MLIETTNYSFNTDKLLHLERVSLDHVIVILEQRTLDLRGEDAQQAWTQITEQATTIKEIPVYKGKKAL